MPRSSSAWALHAFKNPRLLALPNAAGTAST
jgi:hypothetical protein